MESDRTESVPFLKQEPNDFPLNFILPDHKNAQQSHSDCDKSQVIPSSFPSTSVFPSPHDISIRADADDSAKEDGLPSQYPDVKISDSLSPPTSGSRYLAGPTLFSPSSSGNVPATSLVCSLNPFDSEMPVTVQLLHQQSDGTESSFRCTETIDLNKKAYDISEKKGSWVSVPIEELSAVQQISLKTDEVFINGEQFISDALSVPRDVSEGVDSGVRNGHMLDKCGSERHTTSPNYTRDTTADGSVKLVEVEEAPISIHNRSTTQVRIRKTESPHVIERASTTEDVGEKEKAKEITDSEAAEQQTQSNKNHGFDGVDFRKIPSKLCERKRTLQNTSSLELGPLPKPCRIQIQRPAEKKLLQGLGIKRYYCTVCEESFSRRQQLRRHVLVIHEGKSQPCLTKIPNQPSVSMTFTCPLCGISYARKYGLKRHFASKHGNASRIPCPECKFKAAALGIYLQHIVKHKPKRTEARNSSPFQESQSQDSQLKCRECFKLFHSSDALRLHVIEHKIISRLSQVESLLPLEKISKCSCVSSEDKASNYSSLCALHMTRAPLLSLEEASGPTFLNHLPQELKLEVKRSFNVILKLTSLLEFLARSVTTLNIGCASWDSQIPLPAINHISALSSELTNLSTSLWQVLHCHFHEKDETGDVSSGDDHVEENGDNGADAVEGRKGEILEGDGEIVQKKVEGQTEENSDIAQEKDESDIVREKDEEMLSLQYEGHFQENKQKIGDENEGEIFHKKGKVFIEEEDKLGGAEGNETDFFQTHQKEFAQKNVQHAIVKESKGAISQLKCKGSVQENDRKAVFDGNAREILHEKDKGLVQEDCDRLVLEEVDDFAVVEDLVIDKFAGEKFNEPSGEASLGQALTVKFSKKKIKRSERQALTNISKVQTRRSERQALKVLKASKTEAETNAQLALPTSEHSKAEAKHPRRRRARKILKKVIDDYRSSKSTSGYECQDCGKNFTNCTGLKRHVSIHSGQRPFKCMVCRKPFRRPEHLKRHMVTHSDERPFQCNLCDYAAKTSKTLHVHSLTHGDHQRLPCKKCSYKGRTEHELSRHERKHSPCPFCGYVASDVADYKMHKRTHVVYSCTECSYSCYANWQLKRHSIKHKVDSDVDKLYCELCGYSCIDKRRLAYHMTRHENKTPLSCSLCDYKCSSRASFEGHKLMHAGLKPYLCSICGASFRRPSTLKNHMLVHNEEKKHVCRTCGRPFRARHNLRAHEMIHTGERKYKCQLCSFACRRNRELAAHMTKHRPHDGKDKDSKICDSQYDSKAG